MQASGNWWRKQKGRKQGKTNPRAIQNELKTTILFTKLKQTNGNNQMNQVLEKQNKVLVISNVWLPFEVCNFLAVFLYYIDKNVK